MHMQISTITCHHVYNFGASLQAYALQEYLQSQGHSVQIIDYRPEYLSRAYSFRAINNPAWDRFGYRTLYRLLKFPSKFKQYVSGKKQAFDKFEASYLHLSSKRYCTLEELKTDDCFGELVLAGSDQIWNPYFKNGIDPVFYLQFINNPKTKKASYAASFAVDKVDSKKGKQISQWIKSLDAVSVREKTGIKILDGFDICGNLVCDPVLLICKEKWEQLMVECPIKEKFIFVYDFDLQEKTIQMVKEIAKSKKIVSVYSSDPIFDTDPGMGPREFLSYLASSETVITNSYHALLFSLIFHKDFLVVKRKEPINSRVLDMLSYLKLENRLITEKRLDILLPVDWDEVDNRLSVLIQTSKNFLGELTNE